MESRRVFFVAQVEFSGLKLYLEPDGHPFINGCFNWMMNQLYIGNGRFTKHPFKTGCLGFQVEMTLARYTPNFSGHGAYKWPKIHGVHWGLFNPIS